jgi:hypothetical protein
LTQAVATRRGYMGRVDPNGAKVRKLLKTPIDGTEVGRMTARARQHTRAALGATVAVLVVALALFTFARLRDDRSDDRPINDDAIAGIAIPGEPPLAGGERVSLIEAVRLSDLPIYRPNTSLASDDAIGGVWIRGGDSAEVYVRYDSGVTLTIYPAKGRPTIEAWAEELIGDGIDGSVQGIDGTEAFVVRQHLPSLGSVRFFLGTALVVIIGDGDFSEDQLKSLAVSTIESADAIEAEDAAP